MARRFVLEGTWSGYTSSQCRVVHRQVIGAKMAEQAKALRSIQYTDGTSLLIRIRPAEPRERVQEEHSYTSLIRDALKFGGSHVRVADMIDASPKPKAVHDPHPAL